MARASRRESRPLRRSRAPRAPAGSRCSPSWRSRGGSRRRKPGARTAGSRSRGQTGNPRQPPGSPSCCAGPAGRSPWRETSGSRSPRSSTTGRRGTSSAKCPRFSSRRFPGFARTSPSSPTSRPITSTATGASKRTRAPRPASSRTSAKAISPWSTSTMKARRPFPGRGRRIPFSRHGVPEGGAGVAEGWLVSEAGGQRRQLLPAQDLALPGAHNLENALAAVAAADCLGTPVPAMREGLLRFTGLPHRTEIVAEGAGVTWINDSKGTNVDATAKALEGFPDGRVLLILGGRDKKGDFGRLAPAGAPACAARPDDRRGRGSHRAGPRGRDGHRAVRDDGEGGGARGRRGPARRHGAALARLRFLRPVCELRGAGRALRPAGTARCRARPARTGGREWPVSSRATSCSSGRSWRSRCSAA